MAIINLTVNNNFPRIFKIKNKFFADVELQMFLAYHFIWWTTIIGTFLEEHLTL